MTGRFYAKAQNIARNLRKAYDTALDTYDVLVMPTVPKKAPILPDKNCSIEGIVYRMRRRTMTLILFSLSRILDS